MLRSAFAAAAVPASWFALLVGVPLTAAMWGWTPLQIGLLTVPAALIGFLSPWITRQVLGRLSAQRAIASSCPIAIAALLVAATAAAGQVPALLLVSIAFGIGQPALISTVDGAVPASERGVAIGIATLIFLVGTSIGAALVGGLAEVAGSRWRSACWVRCRSRGSSCSCSPPDRLPRRSDPRGRDCPTPGSGADRLTTIPVHPGRWGT